MDDESTRTWAEGKKEVGLMSEINVLVLNKLKEVLKCDVTCKNNTFEDGKGLFCITNNGDDKYREKFP